MPRRKPSQLPILDRNGERGERPIAKRDRTLDFGERWSYAPAPEAHGYIRLRDHYQLFIGGKFVAPKSGEYFDSVNPATEEKLTEISFANERDVDRAVKAARRAYKNVWSKTPGRERGKYLFRIARLIQEKARELAVLETMDGGKTIRESRDIDLPLVAAHFFYYAGWADKLDYAFPGAGGVISRRRRADHSLEFPVANGCLEARAGAGLREYMCAEARGNNFYHRATSGRDFARSRASRWRRQHRHRRG